MFILKPNDISAKRGLNNTGLGLAINLITNIFSNLRIYGKRDRERSRENKEREAIKKGREINKVSGIKDGELERDNKKERER